MATRFRQKRAGVAASAQATKASASSRSISTPLVGNPLIGNPLISDAKLKQIYTTMLRCSLLRQSLASVRGQGKAAGSVIGEAVAAGAAIDLRREDWVPATHVLASFVKGLPLSAIFAQDHGAPTKKTIAWNDGAQHLPHEEQSRFGILPNATDPAAVLNLAAGVSLALQAGKSSAVVMVFCGEISGHGEHWHEALTFAGKHFLPLVIVQTKRPAKAAVLRSKNRPFPGVLTVGHLCGVPVIPVDAHDVVAIYRVAYESIHKARHGGGPTLIQATEIPPLREDKAHSGKRPDAITKMEDYLTAKGLFSGRWKAKAIEAFQRELDSAIKSAAKTISRGRR